MSEENLEVYLAAPRGFCGGVRNAVDLAEAALKIHGAPIYVRHEIVHNKYLVNSFKKRGVVFIEDFSEIDNPCRPLIISAHGAPLAVYKEAQKRGITVVDATCPLVKKVHKKIVRLAKENKNIIVVGNTRHPEIVGTVGQLKNYPNYKIISTKEDAEALSFDNDAPIGLVTQTTLSTTDVEEIMQILRRKFGAIETLEHSDTCYATTHRQAAIRELAKHVEAVVVVGSKNSSNSQQLAKIARETAQIKSFLIDDVSEMPWDELKGIRKLGISSGASAPKELVEEILNELKNRYANLKFHDIIVAKENEKLKSLTN